MGDVSSNRPNMNLDSQAGFEAVINLHSETQVSGGGPKLVAMFFKDEPGDRAQLEPVSPQQLSIMAAWMWLHLVSPAAQVVCLQVPARHFPLRVSLFDPPVDFLQFCELIAANLAVEHRDKVDVTQARLKTTRASDP